MHRQDTGADCQISSRLSGSLTQTIVFFSDCFGFILHYILEKLILDILRSEYRFGRLLQITWITRE